MNRLVIICLAVFTTVMISSCEKTSTNDVSRVTFYPDFDVSGGQFESIVQGGVYNDPGVIATEGGTEINVTVTGTVDGSTVGIYEINYSAVNKDGFQGSYTRYVAVLPATDNSDIAGDYDNVGGLSLTAVIDEVAPGFYRTSNCWGGTSGAVIPALFICVDGATITIPSNELSGFGPVSGMGTIDASGLIEWDITLSAFGITRAKSWQRI